MNAFKSKKLKQFERNMDSCDYILQVIQQRKHDLDPESEEMSRLLDNEKKVLEVREQLITSGKLTGDQIVNLVKIGAYVILGITVLTASYWIPQAEKALRFLTILPK